MHRFEDLVGESRFIAGIEHKCIRRFEITEQLFLRQGSEKMDRVGSDASPTWFFQTRPLWSVSRDEELRVRKFCAKRCKTFYHLLHPFPRHEPTDGHDRSAGNSERPLQLFFRFADVGRRCERVVHDMNLLRSNPPS